MMILYVLIFTFYQNLNHLEILLGCLRSIYRSEYGLMILFILLISNAIKLAFSIGYLYYVLVFMCFYFTIDIRRFFISQTFLDDFLFIWMIFHLYINVNPSIIFKKNITTLHLYLDTFLYFLIFFEFFTYFLRFIN